LEVPDKDVVIPEPRTPERAAIRERIDGSAVGAPFGTNGTGEQRANDPPESPMAYIRRRIAEIISRGPDARPP
jgi:hypothetical protein